MSTFSTRDSPSRCLLMKLSKMASLMSNWLESTMHKAQHRKYTLCWTGLSSPPIIRIAWRGSNIVINYKRHALLYITIVKMKFCICKNHDWTFVFLVLFPSYGAKICSPQSCCLHWLCFQCWIFFQDARHGKTVVDKIPVMTKGLWHLLCQNT